MPYADKKRNRQYHREYDRAHSEKRLARQRRRYAETHPNMVVRTPVGDRRVEYRAYHAAKTRCTNPKQASWKYYGAQGVEFRFTSFEQFYAEVGPKPSHKHSLDRFPNKYGHYEPGNVRWATDEEQANNRRETFHIVNGTFVGRKHSKKTKELMSKRRAEWHRRNRKD